MTLQELKQHAESIDSAQGIIGCFNKSDALVEVFDFHPKSEGGTVKLVPKVNTLFWCVQPNSSTSYYAVHDSKHNHRYYKVSVSYHKSGYDSITEVDPKTIPYSIVLNYFEKKEGESQ